MFQLHALLCFICEVMDVYVNILFKKGTSFEEDKKVGMGGNREHISVSFLGVI